MKICIILVSGPAGCAIRLGCRLGLTGSGFFILGTGSIWLGWRFFVSFGVGIGVGVGLGC